MDTRQRLLSVASQLLDEGGREAVTLREVGARAGLSRGAAYRHFASREDLLSAAVAAYLMDLADALGRAAQGQPPRAALRRVLLTFCAHGCRHPQRHRLIFGPPPQLPDQLLSDAADRCLRTLVEQVTACMGTGDILRGEPRAVAALLLATTHGVVELTVSGHLTADKWGTDAQQVIDEALRQLRLAATTHPASD